MTTPDDLTIGWRHDPARTEEVVRFFIANVDTAYISHGELQGGRAISRSAWSPSLAEKLSSEIAGMMAAPPIDAARFRALAIAEQNGEIAALAMIGFVRKPSAYAVLDDLVVDREKRGQGIGEALLRWIEGECQARGMERLFLESGVGNKAAHRFFERQHFYITSHVMMKELTPG